jgi:hypothetical protein
MRLRKKGRRKLIAGFYIGGGTLPHNENAKPTRLLRHCCKTQFRSGVTIQGSCKQGFQVTVLAVTRSLSVVSSLGGQTHHSM